MPSAEPHRSLDELARLAGGIFERQVKPSLRPEDDGSFVAIDVDEFEADPSDYAAISRLRSRKPAADIWLVARAIRLLIGRGSPDDPRRCKCPARGH